MHRATQAILENFAILADASAHPFAVAEDLETVFPDIEEVILIDIALGKASVDVGAGGDATVHQHGADRDACTAEVEPIADLALIGSHIGLAAELGIDFSLLAGGHDEVHQLLELFVIEL